MNQFSQITISEENETDILVSVKYLVVNHKRILDFCLKLEFKIFDVIDNNFQCHVYYGSYMGYPVAFKLISKLGFNKSLINLIKEFSDKEKDKFSLPLAFSEFPDAYHLIFNWMDMTLHSAIHYNLIQPHLLKILLKSVWNNTIKLMFTTVSKNLQDCVEGVNPTNLMVKIYKASLDYKFGNFKQETGLRSHFSISNSSICNSKYVDKCLLVCLELKLIGWMHLPETKPSKNYQGIHKIKNSNLVIRQFDLNTQDLAFLQSTLDILNDKKYLQEIQGYGLNPNNSPFVIFKSFKNALTLRDIKDRIKKSEIPALINSIGNIMMFLESKLIFDYDISMKNFYFITRLDKMDFSNLRFQIFLKKNKPSKKRKLLNLLATYDVTKFSDNEIKASQNLFLVLWMILKLLSKPSNFQKMVLYSQINTSFISSAKNKTKSKLKISILNVIDDYIRERSILELWTINDISSRNQISQNDGNKKWVRKIVNPSQLQKINFTFITKMKLRFYFQINQSLSSTFLKLLKKTLNQENELATIKIY